MTRNTKIILGILAGLVVVCICGVSAVAAVGIYTANRVANYAEENMSEDPAAVEASAASMAAFDPPSGFEPKFTMDLLGMKMVGYERDNHAALMLMQVPAYMQIEPAQLQKQMEQAFQNQYNTGGTQVELVDEIETEINGQPATLTISDFTTDDGRVDRQLMTMFQGQNGMVMLMLVSPADSWDQDEVDALIASIR